MDLNSKLSLNRRHSLSLLTATLAAAAVPAQAQRMPQEGIHYKRLPQRLPGTPGKIDVLEFFWYGCPHCYAFEPLLLPWIKALPANVEFRHVHVDFRANTRNHQRLYYTLQAMGVEHLMRAAIFKAIHEQGNMLETPEAMVKLLQPLGLDPAKFRSTWAALDVKGLHYSRIAAANRLVTAYNLDGVPAIGIGGIFLTSPGMATRGEQMPEVESGRRALILTDILVKLVPKA
jgi:thiol:disulfide interchange protein DsbA